MGHTKLLKEFPVSSSLPSSPLSPSSTGMVSDVTGSSTLLSTEIDVFDNPESGVVAVEVTDGPSTVELTPNKGGIVCRSSSVKTTRLAVPPQLDLIISNIFSLMSPPESCVAVVQEPLPL